MKVWIEHHYGWTAHEFEADSPAEAAYLAVRETHRFLTDDNHGWRVEEGGFEWGGKVVRRRSIVVSRNERSPWPHPLAPDWSVNDEFWFGVSFSEEDPNE